LVARRTSHSAGLAALLSVTIASWCAAADLIGPNLVANGDFEQADPAVAGKALDWDRPDGLGVQWGDAPPGKDGESHGKAVRMDTAVSEKAMMEQWAKVGIKDWNIPKATNDPVAATYGLSLYSKAFPIEAGRAYRVSVAFHGAGAKIWVRGYGELTHGGTTEKRRLYEAVAELTPSKDGWAVTTHDFDPTKHTPKVTEMKVMLFAYWPPGVSWFDDVQVRALEPGPATGK
jgi:hypothetical protein